MPRQVPFTEYEAALLLDAYLKTLSGEKERMESVRDCSLQLRQMALNAGSEIDDIYRNVNGISFQMASMESAYQGHTIMKPATRLFTEIVFLYRNDAARYRQLLKEAKGMASAKIDNEAVFMAWLAQNASGVQLSELYLAFKEIEQQAKKVKIIRTSLYESLDPSTIKKVKAGVESSKIFKFTHKHQWGRITSALNYLLQFASQKTTETKTQETARVEMVESVKELEIVPSPDISSNALLKENIKSTKVTHIETEQDMDQSGAATTVNFHRINSMAFSKPVSLSYFGEVKPESSWKGLYVDACKSLLDDYPDIFTRLKAESLHGSGKTWLVDVENLHLLDVPKQLEEGLFVETNRNASDLVKNLKWLLDECSVDYENVVITYTNKDGKKEASVPAPMTTSAFQKKQYYTQLLTDDSDPDHPLEIAIIPPRPEHDYYTLVTVGLSRHRMGFPEERWEEKLERAELLINLPRDWKLTKADCREERWSWPIRMMLATAHFAMEDPEVGLESRTTLDEGEDGIPFAENTELRGEILLCPGVFGTDSFFCRLPDGDEVNFYQVIPLYREEIQYKLEHGSDALLDLCPDESLEVINPHRLNVVTDREKISYDPAEMDNAAEQIKKIRALHLPVDELDACNRMAFFLGWAMKRGQMSNPFLSRHREVVEAVRAGKRPDLRVFILDKLDGKLSTQFFDRRGSGFAQWYAQDNRSNPYIYRRDCRNIVLAESKDRVWNSIAEKDAAYLLLPYTEKSRQRVEQLLDERYQQYLEAEFADDPEERVARAAEGKPAVIPDWDGPLFCYASDRVAQDGCKVQIMDRLFPEREDMGWESGWAFYSGDEGDVYGEGDEYYESHCGFYDIRDICRIDPDIIPLLNLPYGTMQMRGEDGAWYEVIRDDEGEEET